MARQRVQSGLKDWDGADEVLLKIGRLERQIKEENAALQENIASLKEGAALVVKGLQNQIKLLELQLKDFGLGHQADLGEKKSRILNFGKLGFRFSTKIILPRAKAALETVVDLLLSLKLKKCLKIKISILKDEVKKLDEATLTKLKALGVRKEAGDVFFYEINEERIKEAA